MSTIQIKLQHQTRDKRRLMLPLHLLTPRLSSWQPEPAVRKLNTEIKSRDPQQKQYDYKL